MVDFPTLSCQSWPQEALEPTVFGSGLLAIGSGFGPKANRHTTIPIDYGPISAYFDNDPKFCFFKDTAL